jgi:hypothetical protein
LTALYVLLIYFVARRHNWARLALLIWIVASFIPYIIWWPEFEADPWWTWIGFVLASLLELVALSLLFTRRASLWYATRVTT